jgi:hypothetical protein
MIVSAMINEVFSSSGHLLTFVEEMLFAMKDITCFYFMNKEGIVIFNII